ncbi:MAG: CCA tRNA nucleotidyltransferase [Acholeplasmataceae bacterium]|nr:CCA tRNA nucleotidyltransferase [Acholeplasmataceae bacterium]
MKDALKIITILKKAGFEAYLVGGVVRDYFLKMPFNDIDITTSAKPWEVEKLFHKTKPTGLKFGTVTVFMASKEYEVTTFREDFDYLDSRHPNRIVFTDKADVDVKRRDFTINGLLLDSDLNLLDFVGGKKDLDYKIIKAIGDPNIRFKEDALRILRAFYFVSKLGFEIEEETLNSIKENRFSIYEIAFERVLNEITKLLNEKHQIKALKYILDCQVDEVLPGLSDGIKYLVKNDLALKTDRFFCLAFTLNGSVPNYWRFSNKYLNYYQKVVELANLTTKISSFELYNYGINISSMANHINLLLNRTTQTQDEVNELYKKMPIKSVLDLAITAEEIIKIKNKKAGAWLKKVQDKLIAEIISGQLENKYESIIVYLNNMEV